jgi:ribose transport system permease protein
MKPLRQMWPLLVAVVALLALFRLWVGPIFLLPENLLDLIQQISVNAILAFGMTLVILIGGIDLSVGRLQALVGTVTVYSLIQFGGGALPQSVNLVLALLTGMIVAMLFGWINGWCAAKTKMPPFIITLATMMVARGIALRFNEGRPMRVPPEQTWFLALGNGQVWHISVQVLVMLALFVAMTALLHRTRFGQHLYAIGGNREAARYTGINIARHETVVYVLCALLAGVAGMIHASQLYEAEPDSGDGFELQAIAAVVVGGTSFSGGIGTMYGTLIGAVIIGILSKGLNQAGVHHSLQQIVKGLVIIAAVYLDARRRNRSV